MKWPVLYPVFLKLEDAPVVVVGAGEVGMRKIDALVRAGARITVVAPEAGKAVERLAAKGRMTWQAREFEPADLDGALLACAATPSAEVNADVARAAGERGVWVNVADTPDLCTFYLPSVVDRHPLKMAVSTSGACPAYARSIGQRLDGMLDTAAGEFVELLGKMRERVREKDPKRVGAASQAFVQSGAEEAWLRGERDAAREILEDIVEEE